MSDNTRIYCNRSPVLILDKPPTECHADDFGSLHTRRVPAELSVIFARSSSAARAAEPEKLLSARTTCNVLALVEVKRFYLGRIAQDLTNIAKPNVRSGIRVCSHNYKI